MEHIRFYFLDDLFTDGGRPRIHQIWPENCGNTANLPNAVTADVLCFWWASVCLYFVAQ